MAQPTTSRARQQGFTLIEVLVAISVMAIMALMAWRGMDSMLRTQTGLQHRADQIRTLAKSTQGQRAAGKLSGKPPAGFAAD